MSDEKLPNVISIADSEDERDGNDESGLADISDAEYDYKCIATVSLVKKVGTELLEFVYDEVLVEIASNKKVHDPEKSEASEIIEVETEKAEAKTADKTVKIPVVDLVATDTDPESDVERSLRDKERQETSENVQVFRNAFKALKKLEPKLPGASSDESDNPEVISKNQTTKSAPTVKSTLSEYQQNVQNETTKSVPTVKNTLAEYQQSLHNETTKSAPTVKNTFAEYQQSFHSNINGVGTSSTARKDNGQANVIVIQPIPECEGTPKQIPTKRQKHNLHSQVPNNFEQYTNMFGYKQMENFTPETRRNHPVPPVSMANTSQNFANMKNHNALTPLTPVPFNQVQYPSSNISNLNHATTNYRIPERKNARRRAPQANHHKNVGAMNTVADKGLYQMQTGTQQGHRYHFQPGTTATNSLPGFNQWQYPHFATTVTSQQSQQIKYPHFTTGANKQTSASHQYNQGQGMQMQSVHQGLHPGWQRMHQSTAQEQNVPGVSSMPGQVYSGFPMGYATSLPNYNQYL